LGGPFGALDLVASRLGLWAIRFLISLFENATRNGDQRNSLLNSKWQTPNRPASNYLPASI
jgi:hypothetical protein